MSKQRSTTEIVEEIKNILSTKNKGKKVFDSDVAGVLRLTYVNLATMKRRNKIPYEQVVLFCDRCGLDSHDIFFDKKKNC